MCEDKNKNEVKIDVSRIPSHAQEHLARATLEFIERILSQPGGREALDKKIKELGL